MLNRSRKSNIWTLIAYIGALSFVCFLTAAIQWQRDKRILASTPALATIEKAWVETGKYGGTFATLSFQREQAGKTIPCHLDRIWVGPTSATVTLGQTVKLVPRTNSCYQPDMRPDEPEWFSVQTLILMGVAASLTALFLTRNAYRKARAAQASAPRV
ncbi:MAG TPA: hypothetical protein VGM57_05105 [Pseudolabrys sp.]|jgi:hypothetical protein